MNRYQSGMQFDSIDFENFRDTYADMYDEKLSFTDEELESRLKHCGILYKDRLFPAEGIIDNGTKERLFTYIENNFAAGAKVLYYKAIFSDLADAFVYCFSLTDEQMLKAYIEHTAEKGKYYFHSNFMSTEKNVKIDHSAEIEDFMLAAGKPLSYDEAYEGLSHISKDIIYREIRTNSNFLMNARECYFHIDIFEFSESDGDRIAEILNKEIDENGYAMIYFFENCKDAIRTIPLMMYDEHKPEDLDSDLEDHACDEIRYFCMMRPIAPRAIKEDNTPLYDPLNQYANHNTSNRAIFRRL